ncbi:MAG TPA: peptidoglycan endopeptidase [Allosphingosinicella sp.]|nr:peptidoglycan endopeptidase [Allosphingosinicella sp.]
MGRRADLIVARARRLVGVRFRPQGREAAAGLDCIGLAAAALGIEAPPADYALRGGLKAKLEEGLRAAGLRPVAAARAGDLLVLVAGAGQLHLAIWTGGGLIHADAALRRIVERPGPAPWPLLGVWRLKWRR